MLNFDFNLTVNKKQVEVKNNTVKVDDAEWGWKLSHQAVNTINEQYLNKIEKSDLSFLKNQPVDYMIKVAHYIRDARDSIIQLKNLTTSRGKAFEELRTHAYRISNSKLSDIPYQGLSLVDKIKLSDAAKHSFGVPGEYEIEEWYDFSKDDDSKIISMMEKVKDDDRSPDGKYTTAFLKDCSKVLITVNAFRQLRDEAGDDLINWSQHKISRWVNQTFDNKKKSWDDASRVCSWRLSNYVEQQVDILKEKGIVPIEKTKKKSKANAVINSYYQYSEEEKRELSQADLLRVFKKCNPDAINYFSNETVELVFDTKNDTKVMEKAFSGNEGALVKQYALTSETPDQFKKAWYKAACSGNITSFPIEVVNKFKEHCTLEEVVKYLKEMNRGYHREALDIPEEMFNHFFSKSIGVSKYKINDSLSEMFLDRADDTEKLLFLEALGVSDKNIYCYVGDKSLAERYNNVDFPELKELVMQEHFTHKFLREIYPIVLKHKDDEIAYKMLINFEYCWSESGIAISLFETIDDKVKVYYDLNAAKKSKYSSIMSKVLTKEELFRYFKASLNTYNQDQYQETVFNILKGDKEYLPKLKESVLENNGLGFFHYGYSNKDIIASPNWKDVRMHLIKTLDIVDGDLDRDFFKDISREELLMCFDVEDFTDVGVKYVKHFPEKLDHEELSYHADRDRKFLRTNTELLGYKYFKKCDEMFEKGPEATSMRKNYFSTSNGGGYTNEDKEFMAKVKKICKYKGSNTIEFMFEDGEE
jgi:hypothetical protein